MSSLCFVFKKCLDSESHTYCMTICQPLVVFVSAGSSDMIMFNSTIQPHVHCISFDTLVYNVQVALMYVTFLN